MAELSYNAIAELLNMLDFHNATAELTNAQLSAILIERVWADLPIDSVSSALIAEIADRLDALPPKVVARQSAHVDAYIEGLRQDYQVALYRARMAEQTLRVMRNQIELLEATVRGSGGM